MSNPTIEEALLCVLKYIEDMDLESVGIWKEEEFLEESNERGYVLKIVKNMPEEITGGTHIDPTELEYCRDSIELMKYRLRSMFDSIEELHIQNMEEKG